MTFRSLINRIAKEDIEILSELTDEIRKYTERTILDEARRMINKLEHDIGFGRLTPPSLF